MTAEPQTWTWPSKSSPGTTHITTRHDDGRLTCTCPGFTGPRHRCWHVEAASGELGYDPSDPIPIEGEVTVPRLMTSAYWAWREEMGVACQVTIGAPPADFPVEVDTGLRHLLAPWPPLFTMVGEDFGAAYKAKLSQIGVERIRAAIRQIARRHPGQNTPTALCFEPTWGRPAHACHVWAEWWQAQTGAVVESPAPAKTQPTPTPTPLLGGILDASNASPAASANSQTITHEKKKEEGNDSISGRAARGAGTQAG